MNGLFYSDSEDSSVVPPGRQYQALAFTIWLAAVVIMSVLFNNLLVRMQHGELSHQTQAVLFPQVGLAVGEVSSVIEKARITTIKQRV